MRKLLVIFCCSLLTLMGGISGGISLVHAANQNSQDNQDNKQDNKVADQGIKNQGSKKDLANSKSDNSNNVDNSQDSNLSKAQSSAPVAQVQGPINAIDAINNQQNPAAVVTSAQPPLRQPDTQTTATAAPLLTMPVTLLQVPVDPAPQQNPPLAVAAAPAAQPQTASATAPVAPARLVSQQRKIAFNLPAFTQRSTEVVNTAVTNAVNTVATNIPPVFENMAGQFGSSYTYGNDAYSPQTTKKLYELAAALAAWGLLFLVGFFSTLRRIISGGLMQLKRMRYR